MSVTAEVQSNPPVHLRWKQSPAPDVIDISDPALNSEQVTDTLELRNVIQAAVAVYQKDLDAFAISTVGEYTRRNIDYRSYFRYWEAKAKFAGEIIHFESSFEIGREMLEECYSCSAALLAERGAHLDNSETFKAIEEVVRQMGRHPALQERAFEILSDAKTYGLTEQTCSSEVLEFFRNQCRDLFQLPAGHASKEVRRVYPRIALDMTIKAITSVVTAAKSLLAPTPALPARTLERMRSLALVAVDSFGDSNMLLAEVLLDSYKQLRELIIRQMRFEGFAFQDYIGGDIEDLKKHQMQHAKLLEIAMLESDRGMRGDCYFQLFGKLAERGEVGQALELLKRAKSIPGSNQNEAFAVTSTTPDTRAKSLDHIRRIGGKEEVARLIIVGRSAYQQGAFEEARDIYIEAFDKSKKSGSQGLLSQHQKNVVRHFIDIAKETKLKFDGLGWAELLAQSEKSAYLVLENMPRGSEYQFTRFVDEVIRAFSRTALYERAEKLAYFKDQKARIEPHGSWTRPEERDAGYTQVVCGAAERLDYGSISTYLSKQVERRGDTAKYVAIILADKGDFENALIAAEFSAGQLTTTDGAINDIEIGEAIFEVGRAMAEQGENMDRIGKTLLAAAQKGIGEITLSRLINVTRRRPDLLPYLPAIMQAALDQNPNYFKCDQRQLILAGLREFFEELKAYQPSIGLN